MPRFRLLRALRHPNYRLYFFGQALSLTGTWTQQAGMQWLLSQLASSKTQYGLVGFLAQLPALLLPPAAGVLADRGKRRSLLLATQSLSLLQSLSLAALVITDRASLLTVALLNLALSIVNALDLPTRQAFLGDIIDNRDDLANAIALNSSLVNGTRLIGPGLAAVLMVSVGVAGCFLVNALSFVAVLVALMLMRVSASAVVVVHPPFLAGLIDGWSYVRNDKPIRAALLIVAAMSLFGLPYNLLLPYFTREILRGDVGMYGFLMTAPGLGAFSAGIWIASRGLRGVTRRMLIAPIVAGLSLLAASWTSRVEIAFICLFGAGFGFLTLLNSANTLIQTVAAPDKRGRVLGFYAIAFTGMSPLGNLLVPAIAERVGTPNAMRIGASACLLAGLVFLRSASSWRTELRARVAATRAPEPLPEAEPAT